VAKFIPGIETCPSIKENLNTSSPTITRGMEQRCPLVIFIRDIPTLEMEKVFTDFGMTFASG
jgi:hypothetical protein